MINLMFGAHCPQFTQMLTTELERVQNGDEHEYVDIFSQYHCVHMSHARLNEHSEFI